MMRWLVIVRAIPCSFPPEGVQPPRSVRQRGRKAIDAIAPASGCRADSNRRTWPPPRPVGSRPVRDCSHSTLAGPPPGKHRGTCDPPIGRPVPGRPPVPFMFGEAQGEGRPGPLAAPPRPTRVPGRPRSTSDFNSHRESSRAHNRREVDRGWDAIAADTRQGPPGLVCTTTTMAVRPLPGIRPPGPGPGSGASRVDRRRAGLSRMTTRDLLILADRRRQRLGPDAGILASRANESSCTVDPRHQPPRSKDHHVRSHHDDTRLSRLALPRPISIGSTASREGR